MSAGDLAGAEHVGAPPWLRRMGPLLLIGIMAVGLELRITGFTSTDLWFDDAWAALPSTVPLKVAVKMVATNPGWVLATRSWIGLHPGVSWWAQVPAFVLGLVGIVTVFALLRALRTWWPLPYLGALVIAVSPVAATYSTRVKEYSADLVLACLLLWLAERWRRAPTTRNGVALGFAAAAAMFISASQVVVVAGAMALCGWTALASPARRRSAAIAIVVPAVCGLAEYELWLGHLTRASLDHGWTTRGNLANYASLHQLAFSIQQMGAGLVHGFVALPTGLVEGETYLRYPGLAVAVGVFAILAVLTLPPLLSAIRAPRAVPGPSFVAAVSIIVALALAFARVAPFGGGRIDEVLYPSLLVLAALAFTARVERRRVRAPKRRWAELLAALVVAGCAVIGLTNHAAYPTLDLRSVASAIGAGRTSVPIVVDSWNSFAWGLYQPTPTAVSFERTWFPWSQGFHIVSHDPKVLISRQYFYADAPIRELHQVASATWWVGVEVGATSTVTQPANAIVDSRVLQALLREGWRRTPVERTSVHAVALLLAYAPNTPPTAVVAAPPH